MSCLGKPFKSLIVMCRVEFSETSCIVSHPLGRDGEKLVGKGDVVEKESGVKDAWREEEGLRRDRTDEASRVRLLDRRIGGLSERSKGEEDVSLP